MCTEIIWWKMSLLHFAFFGVFSPVCIWFCMKYSDRKLVCTKYNQRRHCLWAVLVYWWLHTNSNRNTNTNTHRATLCMTEALFLSGCCTDGSGMWSTCVFVFVYNQRRYCLCLVLGVSSVFVLLVEFVFVIVFAYVFVFECICSKYNQRRQCLWAGLVYRWLRREVR